MNARHRRLAWFLAVGCTAAAVHWAVVVALVDGAGARPLAANVGGWLVAFMASFAGHHRLTFGAERAPVGTAARRFFIVSAGGFAINEAAYAVLLHLGLGVGYQWLLAGVLVVVAVLTYWLSRRWAFLRNPAN